MNPKTACLISCSDHYGHRLHILDAFLRSKGYQTTYITSDFDHTEKKVYSCPVEGCVQLHAIAYEKNLSFARILNHRNFARDAFAYLEKLPRQPDLVVAILPPNFLGRYAARYKRRHPEVPLLFDIFDLWPETFPSGRLKKLLSPVFKVWAWLRDSNLSAADFVTTECEMFRWRLGLSQEGSATVYLCGKELTCALLPPALAEDRLELCYVGAINNVIGIDGICRLLTELTAKKPVTLHIIGKGEQQDTFIARAKEAGAQVEFYGAVYDDEKKQAIMSRCHFGLNIMKEDVCVGLTMKSLDYFRHGLPIINSIPADTQEFVEQQSVGFQLEDGCAEKILRASVAECLQMRENARKLFTSHFAPDVILQQYERLLKELL